MSNEDINPNYKGRFLKNIVADYNLNSLELDEGTVLIQELDDIKVYFQLDCVYTYYNEWGDESKMFFRKTKNDPLKILPGSAIDAIGRFLPDSQKFCLAQHIRFPADDELEWYEKQNVI